ncbi:MAG: VOC family protein [Solirubrobacteraceae bacterium]|nr:VOC family protein [Patulibacter sp.]
MSAKPNGSFCWADLAPGDQPRAEAFYAALAGWHTGPKHPDFDYAMQFLGADETPATRVAGISGAMDGHVPDWNLYLATDDFDATAAAVEAHGGRVGLERFEIPGSGIGGFFVDPAGVTFGVWQSTGHDGFGPFAVPGAFAWAEAYSTDATASRDFFSAVFGLEAATLSETAEFTYFQLKVPGAGDPVFGVMQMGDRSPVGGDRSHFTAYLAVADADAAAAQVVELGGSVQRQPTDTPFGRLATITDSEGAVLNLVDPSRRGGSV